MAVGGEKLPVFYRQSGEPTLISYSYNDVASGLGYVDFWVNLDLGLTSTQYAWKDEDPSTNLISLAAATNNYDTTPFNLPRTILSGSKCYVQYYHGGVAGGNTFKFKLYVVSGGAATAISDQSTNDLNTNARLQVDTLTISSNVTIKKGDTLRLELINSTTTGVYNKTGTSAFKVSVPFRVDN